MWQQLLANNARSTLSVAVTTNTQPTLALQSGHGARFPVIQPGDYCECTLDDGTNVEICRVLANASEGRIVTGQKGYQSASNATADEIHHAAAWLEHQAKEMIRRATSIRNMAHRRLAA